MTNRKVDLSPFEEVCSTQRVDYHTMIVMSTSIIKVNDSYFYIKDDIEKMYDISNMPVYIKSDWINYNKKELSISVINSQIKEFEGLADISVKVNIQKTGVFEDILFNLKSIRRDLIIAGII